MKRRRQKKAQRNQELRTSKYAATDKVRRTTGLRSDLEVGVRAQCPEAKGEKEIPAIEYSEQRPRKYHPDFQLPNGIFIECKGWFRPADRSKHLCIKIQHPELDIRFVFSRSASRLGKGSKTSYAVWCQKNGFLYADKQIPEAWINEAPKLPKVPAGSST